MIKSAYSPRATGNCQQDHQNPAAKRSTRVRIVATQLAPANGVGLALGLGATGTFLSFVGAEATWNSPELGPRWYSAALVVTALPRCWAGGYLEAGRHRVDS